MLRKKEFDLIPYLGGISSPRLYFTLHYIHLGFMFFVRELQLCVFTTRLFRLGSFSPRGGGTRSRGASRAHAVSVSIWKKVKVVCNELALAACLDVLLTITRWLEAGEWKFFAEVCIGCYFLSINKTAAFFPLKYFISMCKIIIQRINMIKY